MGENGCCRHAAELLSLGRSKMGRGRCCCTPGWLAIPEATALSVQGVSPDCLFLALHSCWPLLSCLFQPGWLNFPFLCLPCLSAGSILGSGAPAATLQHCAAAAAPLVAFCNLRVSRCCQTRGIPPLPFFPRLSPHPRHLCIYRLQYAIRVLK